MQRAAVLSLFLVAISLGAAWSTGVSDSILKEIQDHKQDADRIIELVTKGTAKGQTFDRLATMADTYGPRMSGSDRLEQSIDWVLKEMAAEGLENVHGEPALIPRWVRGQEYAQLVQPQGRNLGMLGLGRSIGTPPEGILAEAIVVSSFADLRQKASLNLTVGRIVVFNQECDWAARPTGCYGQTVQYRSNGAVEAARAGAVASLIRSVTPYSLYSPHTGGSSYEPNVRAIPTACITVEDAEMLARMQARGQRIVIRLYMEARMEPSVMSRNVVAEIRGSTYPDEVVVISGHIDSWDVGQGAQDDAGGCFISWQALSLLKQLNLRPKRTLRAIMWTSEEFGGVGASQYFENHKHEVNKFDLVMEADLGTFRPWGIQFTGTDAAMDIMKAIGPLLQSINASLVTTGGGGTDIGYFIRAGVPGASLANDNARYFWYHHTEADMMTALNSADLDLCAATWAVTSYVVADLDEMLPREKPPM